MTNEQKQEIIKALSYGLEENIVSKCNGVDVAEVKIILSECGNEISTKRNEIKEAYSSVF